MEPQKNNFSFLSPNEFQAMYPLSEAKKIKKSKSTTSTYLHNLITNDLFDEKTPITKDGLVTRKDKLTPLHIATMKGNVVAVQLLINAAKNTLTAKEFNNYLNVVDTKGWGAIHFAAITSDEIFEKLKNLKANLNARNSQRGTPEDLKKLVGKIPSNFSMHSSYIKIDTVFKTFADLTQTELESLGLKEYRDLPLFRYPKTWNQLWTKDENPVPILDLIGLRTLTALQKSPPKLIVEDCPEIHGKKLVAGTLIKKGDPIGVYGGEIIIEDDIVQSFIDLFKPPFNQYKFEKIDPTKIGNVIRYANTGRPNALMINFDNCNGTAFNILLAGEDIEENEEILIDYGSHFVTVSYGKDALFARDKLLADYSQGIDEIYNQYQLAKQTCYQKLEKNTLTINEMVDHRMIMSKVLYPLHIPAALLYLHFSESVKVDDWMKFIVKIITEKNLEDAELNATISSNIIDLSVVYSVMKRIQSLDKFINNHKDSLTIKKWVLDSIGKLTIMQILKGFEIIQSTNCDIQSLEKLSDYDWLTDKNASLSYENRKDDFVEFQKLFFPDPNERLSSMIEALEASVNDNPSFEKTEAYRLCKYAIECVKKSP